MSKVTIRYGELTTAMNYGNRLSDGLSSYSGELNAKVRSALAKLPGTDDRGLIASAVSSVDKKGKKLDSLSGSFKSFTNDLNSFVSDAMNADKRVSNSIKSIASSYVGERTWFESACDAVYNFLFVDLVNSNCVTRFLANGAKAVWNWAGDVASNVYDWFKHGDGRYVWNIVSSVVATVAAIAGVITAVAAVVSAGCVAAVVLAVVGVVAAVGAAIITTANSAVKIYNNVKALKEDNPGISRYMGDIDGVSDAVKKYDMGNAAENEGWKTFGVVVDTTEVVCDVLSIVTSVADLGAVKSDLTGRTTGFRFDKENIMRNFRSSLGFDFDENKYTLKGMIGNFGSKTTESWYPNQNGYGGLKWLSNRYTSTQDFINTVFTGNEILSNAMSTLEKGDKVYSKLKSGLDFSTPATGIAEVSSLIIDIYSALGKFKLFGGINSFTVKPYKTVTDIFDLCGIDVKYHGPAVAGGSSGDDSSDDDSSGGGGGW